MTATVPERLERGRLRYERIAERHAADLAGLMREPRVAETLWPWPQPPSDADLRASLEANLAHWERHGFGLWALSDREDGTFVGRGGLQYTDVDGVSTIEAAWAVMPACWGRGLATETAEVAIEVAFGVLNLHELVALTLPHNAPSRRVMEKTGFTYRGQTEHAGLTHVLYARGRRASPADRDGVSRHPGEHTPGPLLGSEPEIVEPL